MEHNLELVVAAKGLEEDVDYRKALPPHWHFSKS